MKKIIMYLSIVLLAAAITAGCGKERARKGKEEVIPVKVMRVELKNVKKVLEYVGNIKGRDEAIVYPKVSGKIIEEVKEENSPVKKGETILYIDRDEIGLKFEKAPVESPLTGVVGRIYVDIGSSVTPQTPVALVTSMDIVEINLDIPEKYMPRVSLGQEAKIAIDAYPGREFTGKVTQISPIVDLQTRSAPIEITVEDNEHLLKSGMFAKAKLAIEEHKDTPVVLKEAIIGKVPNTYVYVVEDKKAILRKVETGLREAASVEVTSGLKAGEKVVIMGQQRLRDGASVEPEE